MCRIQTQIIQMMPATGWNIAWKLNDDKEPVWTEPVLMWVAVRTNDGGLRCKDGTRIPDDHFHDEIYGIPHPCEYVDTHSPEESPDFLGYIRDGENPLSLLPGTMELSTNQKGTQSDV